VESTPPDLRGPVYKVRIAADDRVDALAACEGDEVVVRAILCRRGLLDGVVNDRRVSPDALDELANGPVVDVGRELGRPRTSSSSASRSGLATILMRRPRTLASRGPVRHRGCR
jgi:hypothetical protein